LKVILILNNNAQIKNYFFLGISGRFDIGIPNYNEQPAATNSSSDEHEVILQPPSPFGKETCENHSVNENPGPSSLFGKGNCGKDKVIENTIPGPSKFKASDSITPKQKTTYKKSLLEVSQNTNLQLNNIFKELQTLNQTLKRNMEIQEELLKLKKKKYV
jgi:hypothetical protein